MGIHIPPMLAAQSDFPSGGPWQIFIKYSINEFGDDPKFQTPMLQTDLFRIFGVGPP
jgi:hypothetical protein